MKKSKSKSFTVEISGGLYEFVQELSEVMDMSESDLIRKLFNDDIKRAILKNFGTSLNYDDLDRKLSEEKSLIHCCNKPGNENCPFMNSSSYDDVDF